MSESRRGRVAPFVALAVALACAALFVVLWPQQLDLQRTWPVA